MRQKTIDAIMAHAAAEYPRECCGVVAQKSRVEKFPSESCHQNRLNTFTFRRRLRSSRGLGTVIAIRYSHPDATTQPSELDKAQCDATFCPGIL
jgi:proteasome lid subunit RPN8/RPN11